MTLYQLVFILLFLGSVVGIIVSPFVRSGGVAKRILVTLASIWGVYLVILATTDVFRSQKVYKVGDGQCFDEMCFAVADVMTMPAHTLDSSADTGGSIFVITVQATSQSRGRAQAEGGLRGRLYDRGTYIRVSETAQRAYDAQHGRSPRLTQKIAPGESILSVLVFEVPKGVVHPALTLDHGFTPGYFVIGESPFFHKPDVHQLGKDQP